MRYLPPTSSTCRVLVATVRTDVGSLPPFRAPATSPALVTFSYAEHTAVFASAICWFEYVGLAGGLGAGRNQLPIATPRAMNAIASEAITSDCGDRLGVTGGGDHGGGPAGCGGKGRF